MARVRDFAVTEITGTSTNPSAQVVFPAHVAGDYIMLMLAVDGTNIPGLPSGYTNLFDTAGVSQAYRLCYKLATSSSEVCPALSLSVAEEWHIGVFAISGAPGTNPIAASAQRSTTDNTNPFTWASGATTGTETNCLIFQFANSDNGIALTCVTPGYTNLVNGDAGTAGFGCAIRFQPAAGSILDATWKGRVDADTTACLVAWKDDGNGTRPGYCDASSVGTYLRPIGGTSVIEGDTNPASLTIGATGMRAFTQMWADNAGAFTNLTTAITNSAASDVTITNAVGNAWYFGYDHVFAAMPLQVATAQSGGTIAWEYWNGAAWTALVGQSGALTATGWVRITHTPQSDWAATSVNGVSRFYIRMRISATFTTAPILSRGFAGGWVNTFDAITVASDAGVNPYMDATALTPAATSNFSGSEMQFGAALNMSTGVMLIHHKSVLPRDYAVDVADCDVVYPVTACGVVNKAGSLQNYGGFIIMLADASNNYEAYSIHGKRSLTSDTAAYNVAAIGLNNGAQAYGRVGSLNKSAITRMLMLPQGAFGAMLAHVSSLTLLSNLVFAGGDAANPLTISSLRQIANNSIGTALVLNGVGDFNRVYAPLQFGGGDPINTLVNGALFQFPTRFDGQRYFDWNANDNVAGVAFYGKPGDSLRFPNTTWKGSQPYRWEFNALHSASATIDFTGNTVEGATVTLQPTVTLSSVRFQGCPSFTQNGATITGCQFVNTTVTSATLAGMALISGCSFTKTTGTQHAIEVSGPAGTVALTGVTFTGYASTNGSTGNEAIYVNIASGTVTINVSGGNTPSIRTAGATVVVNNNITITLTGLKNPSEVRVFDAGTQTERSGTGNENVTSGTHAFSVPASTPIDISILSLGYQNMRILAYSSATSATIPISQVIDRQYQNP